MYSGILSEPLNPVSAGHLRTMALAAEVDNHRHTLVKELDGIKPVGISSKILSNESLSALLQQASQDNPVTHIALTSLAYYDLVRSGEWVADSLAFDPASAYTDVMNGYLGKMQGVDAVTDAFYTRVLQYFGPWRWAVFSIKPKGIIT